MDTNVKLLAVIDRLQERTGRGAVEWKKTVEDDSFLTAFPSGTVIVRSRTSYEQLVKPPVSYEIQVFNSDGVLVDGATDAQLDQADDGTGLRLRELHAAARRAALGADKILDDLLANLGKAG